MKDVKELNKSLATLTHGMQYRILDMAKDKDEITAIAEKHSIKLPARDLSIFKGIYAFVDEENLNGCTLPKEEVEKALGTIGGKAVNFDHLRKRVVGHWLEGELVDSKVIAYGIFYKGNFGSDFDVISDLMNQGNLKISMEAWGVREKTKGGSYTLKDIEFSGGALLVNTKPAFANAEVLELAKVLTEPASYIREDNDKILEIARYSVWDTDMIIRLVYEAKNPDTGEMYDFIIDVIDYVNGLVLCHSYSNENDYFLVSVTPQVMPYTAKISEDAARKIIKIEKIDKKAHSALLHKSGKIKTMEESNVMDELKKEMEKLSQEMASLKVSLEGKDKEIASLNEKLTNVQSELEKASATVTSQKEELEKAAAAQVEAVKVAREEAKKIAERRAELGDYAKDMSDEAILNDDKFTIAKKDKEIATLNAKLNGEKKVEAKVEEKASEKTEEGLEVGSKDKKSKAFKSQSLVQQYAFGTTDSDSE